MQNIKKRFKAHEYIDTNIIRALNRPSIGDVRAT